MKKNRFLLAAILFNIILTLLFIIYKMLHVIHWSWWLVLAPSLLNPVVFIITYVKFLIEEKKAETYAENPFATKAVSE